MSRFKNILCVIDSGAVGEPALARAVALSAHNRASLTVIDVIEHVTDIGMLDIELTTAGLQDALRREHAEGLDTMVEPYRSQIEITTKVVAGVPFLAVIREVLGHQHDLVIKSPDQSDWLDRVFGSDDMHLLRKCPCPVWLFTPHAPTSYRRILAAIDVDDACAPAELGSRHALNRQVLELAVSLARWDSAEVHVVHAWEALAEGVMRRGWVNISEERVASYVEQVRRGRETSMDALVQDIASDPRQDSTDALRLRTHLVRGSARKEVPALARRIRADCLVMGTVGRTGVSGFFIGNTAETILNQVTCSVLAIKPPGFVTPVTPEDR